MTIGSQQFAYASGFFGLACAWVVTTSMGYVAIRNRTVEQHRESMIRSDVVTFAFVTFRLLDQLLIAWYVSDLPCSSLHCFTRAGAR